MYSGTGNVILTFANVASEETVKLSRFRAVLFGIGVTILCILLWIFLNAGSNVPKHSIASSRLHNIIMLRDSLREYQSDWDCLPDKLSDLVTNYIDLEHSYVLFGPTSVAGCAYAEFRSVPRIIEDVRRADTHGPYGYFGYDPRSSIILFEKPTAWPEFPKQWWGHGHFIVVNSNWSVQFLSERELLYLINKLTNTIDGIKAGGINSPHNTRCVNAP